MRVLFITQYGPLAASSRTRVFQYLTYLEQAGIESDVRAVISDGLIARFGQGGAASRLLYYFISFLRTAWLGVTCLARASSVDRILIQKVLFPGPLAWLLSCWRHKILFDFDDAIFTSDAPKSLVGRLSQCSRQGGLPRMLRASSVAIVENAYTQAYASRYCDRVEVITGPIDTDKYRPRSRSTGSSVVLGWIGSPTTTVYLNEIATVLRDVARSEPDVSLKLVGADPFEDCGMPIEQVGWSLESEVDELSCFDVGLMPLPDDPWTRGKGGYKLLQYGALGLPVVASPVGVNAEIVADGETGFLADTPKAWVSALSKLIKDPDLRLRMGEAGRQRIVERYSLEKSSEKLINILSCANAD